MLEVPDIELLGPQPSRRQIGVWATTMLASDAGGWRPINRAGHPMIQPIFSSDDSEQASAYNTTAPADDRAIYGERFASQIAAVVAAHGTAADPEAYARAVVVRLLPDVLPYGLGTPACYGFARHNGRSLTDNAPEVMYSLVTNTALSTGLSPRSASAATHASFPYVAPVGE